MRSIAEYTRQELDTFELRYRERGLTEGGVFSLKEILLEKLRRNPNPFGTVEVAAKVIELARASDDGLCTYGQIWSAFKPNTPWEGNHSQSVVASALGRVVHYCVTNRLPILTALVVQTGTRRLSEKAILNIYNDCRDLGLDVGLSPDGFVSEQAKLARQLALHDLPKAED
ncbi:hypothetical protein JQ561_03885 [Bradyrhizobium diazoefficiens]|nr:hypothetical protein [Bradyrhizobium diazoefficiens]MBR0925736.1 hypothetical protein [Bradyrhizobium diazoefficiens]